MIKVFKHQENAFNQISETAQTFFSGVWKNLPIIPRFNRLIVGESGAGKSYLARALAEELNLPIWNGTATNWIPLGCSERGARPTWVDIARYIVENKSGIIFIDEIDKLGTDQGIWIRCVRIEIFALVDRQVPVNLIISSDILEDFDENPNIKDIQKSLSNSFLILAAGAFQHIWDDKPSIGFGDPVNYENFINYRKLTNSLPTELVNRFAPPPVVIQALTLPDYQDLLDTTLQFLDKETRLIAQSIGKKTISAALNDRLGCRWIEQIMLETASIIKQRNKLEQKKRVKQHTKKEQNKNDPE